MKSRLVLVLASCVTVSVLVAACSGGGGGGGGGGFVDNGGQGTGTLKVVMSVTVVEGFLASANLSLTDQNSSAVSAASVLLTTPAEQITMIEETPGLGVYTLPAGEFAYGAGFQLDVTRLTDEAKGITIAAPGLTDIQSPEEQGSIFRGQPAEITWLGEGADQFRIELFANDFNSDWQTGDPGTYVIGGAFITTAGAETLTVRRRKILPITSGRPGSEFKIDLEDDVLVLVQ